MQAHPAHEPAESGYDRLLQGWLSGEMRLVNSGLPRERRRLSELLGEEQPSVGCSDGSHQLFKRTELRFLSDILDENERESLLLPIIIEMVGDGTEAIVLCPSDVELAVIPVLVSRLATVSVGFAPRESHRRAFSRSICTVEGSVWGS
jgi:uncharacterized protein (UPF0216 family)